MTRAFRFAVALACFPRKLFNKVMNLGASINAAGPITIDWIDARILNPACIRFIGSFQAGRGLWLQANGPDSLIEIGTAARLSDWVHIGAVGTIRIGKNVLIGSKVLIIDHGHGRGYREAPEELHIPPADRPLASRGDIHIGNNVWLGDNVIVLSGVSIGDNCVVGANALVRHDLPPNTVCAGSPARVIFTAAGAMPAAPSEAHHSPDNQ